MAVTVLIPGPLRQFAEGQSQVVVTPAPATLRDALETLWKICPAIRDRVMNDQGHIREHINVFVGSEDARYSGGLNTPIPEDSEISIIPSISGG